jgi:hypothetical protein
MRGTATGEERPDADLLRLHLALVAQGDEVARILKECHRFPDGITPESRDQEARLADADDRWWGFVDQITATPAQGVQGLHAKAATMELVLEKRVCGLETLADIEAGAIGGPEHRLALSLASDLLGGRAVA